MNLIRPSSKKYKYLIREENAIAIRIAQEKGNVAIGAKTAKSTGKLEGTIYSAAEEIEAAGGKVLPIVMDVRFEDQVEAAAKKTAEEFGGIDFLVNNASAIHLTNTLHTPMKKFDLMHMVNVRATYLCSKIFLPYMMNRNNDDTSHILNISPPLSMHDHWFADHVAYTMSKYGMSMCTLGMSSELRSSNVAVNSLWPRTAVYTAAMKMLAGENVSHYCRRPEIMADAAVTILSKSVKEASGNFYVDEHVLRDEGVEDFTKYAYDPKAKLLPDFFLDEFSEEELSEFRKQISGTMLQMEAGGTKAKIPEDRFDELLGIMRGLLSNDIVKQVKATFLIHLTREDKKELYLLDLLNNEGSIERVNEPFEGEVNSHMFMTQDTFEKIFGGRLKPTMAFMAGKLRLEGDMSKAMKLDSLLMKIREKMEE
ncbi:hypothetical protein SNEBB_001873 [Seison nebaliae]|nr:hypothetical protein SNEBB_001873 [Seison nebaliae]